MYDNKNEREDDFKQTFKLYYSQTNKQLDSTDIYTLTPGIVDIILQYSTLIQH